MHVARLIKEEGLMEGFHENIVIKDRVTVKKINKGTISLESSSI